MGWKIGEAQMVFRASIFDVYSHSVANPSRGFSGNYYFLECVDWVNIIAVTADRQCIMVNQFRPTFEKSFLEFPGGMMDPADPSPEATARRELEEETGYIAESFELLGSMAPNPAILSNRCHFYLARNATASGKQALEPGEDITIAQIPLATLASLVSDGTISHSLMLAGISYLFSRFTSFDRTTL